MTLAGINIDKTPPVTSASPSGGSFSGPVTVTLNASDALSGVELITYSASGAQTTPPTIVPGATTAFTISASGTTTLSYSARDRAGNAEAPRTATYTVTPSTPAVSLNPSVHAFGDHVVGTTGATSTFMVSNTGTTDLNVLTVSLGGSRRAGLRVVNETCTPALVAPGSSCTSDVIFSPSSTGTKNAQLVINSDAPGSPHNADLSGTAI